MMLLLFSKHRKKIAYTLLVLFYFDLITPAIAASRIPLPRYRFSWDYKSYNDTPATPSRNYRNEKHSANVPAAPARRSPFIGGPGQPEMKSFQSVNTNNMVDLFSGDFNYTLPLVDVGGYTINIHYNSGITMDQEASWVGLGWNINPGTISRSMRGLPDDFDGVSDSVKKTQHIKENKTTGVTIEPSLEIVGAPINVSARLGIFYNTYNGFGLETGVGIGGTGKTTFGSLTGNLSISNNSQEGIRISPSLSVNLGKQDADNNLQGSLGISTGYSSRAGMSSLQINGGIKGNQLMYQSGLLNPGVNYPLATISFATPSYTPSVTMPIKTSAYSFTGKIGGEIWGTDGSASFTGYVNKQEIAAEDVTQSIPAAGYMYSTNANGREHVLLDFNRQNDKEFNYRSSPLIAIPQYTYDAFSISGEGIGGSFRPYRGDVGYIFDHAIVTRSSSTNGSIDVGLGAAVHGGLEITNITTSNANHRWNQGNGMESKLRFQSPDTTYESVYFRNPGEKTTNAQSYYRAIGDDTLIAVKLSGSKENIKAENTFLKYDNNGQRVQEFQVNETLVKKERDKRKEVITCLNASDASIFGLDKTIKSYKENTIPLGQCQDTVVEIPRVDNVVHKKNQLSEISVLNSDGRRYVYGIPAETVLQKDVTFSVNKETNSGNLDKGLTQYTPDVDNTISNNKGKDGYYSANEMPSYAHNFLLTGILTPDYVDLTGNGISEDDPGDAVKFNYTRIYGDDNGFFEWRVPMDASKANYNEGLKTYNRDDKATYLYGRKEVWYLNSVESKAMIAVFRLANDRQDAYAALGENGGVNTAKASRRLERIDLYVKADLIKNGIAKAKPVKSVLFTYTKELCNGVMGDPSKGKLTLKQISFAYNGNNKGLVNPYVFSYHPDGTGAPQSQYNPSFNSSSTDRWGTYKNPADNPAGLSNADFPYSIQDSAKAATNASAWSLTDVKMPSGGRMHISYEADDYAFVQDKRATRMFTIAGINGSGQNNIYNQSSKDDYYTIYINTSDALARKSDIKNRYLAIDDVLYFKLAVTMPADQFGSGTEMVPGYATVEDYGITPGNDHQFWVRVASVEGRSPFSRAALQFLRLNLRSKAYPGSEGIDNIGLKELVKMLATSYTEFKNMILGFDDAAKTKGICNNIDLTRSFVRLSCPGYKKYGGGYRVKRIEVYDNWNQMTGQKESVYGQEYNYTTSEEVDGQQQIISSGVATYEPSIGAEENPFRRPIPYVEKTAPMGPVNYMFSEEPIGESFFASPMVGYSKVRVRTINAKAKSANGWEETEHYTSRDYPTIVSHTLLEEGVTKRKYETQSNILRLNHKSYATLSQGFLIELNDMNGKMKAQSTYAETDSLHPITYTLNFYKTDDDKAFKKHLNNRVWVVDSTNGHIDTSATIGKDIEIMADLREQRSQAYTKGFSPNVDVIAPFIPPFLPVLYLPSRVNLPQKEDTRFRSSAIVKIVQRYGILDSLVTMAKGSIVTTKNILYDQETGHVILARSNNEFNDPVYSFNYPAWWGYSGMGLAYKNIGALFQSKTTGGFQLNEGRLYKEGSSEVYPASRILESGDEVYVYNAVRAVAGADCRFLNSTGEPWKGKLWVMEAAKGKENDHGLYFIDSLGRVAPNLIIGKMVIIRSGKRNLVDIGAGKVIMLENPMKLQAGGNYKIVIDSNSRVLSAIAATFRDMWKVENTEYQEDSCYRMTKIVTGKVFFPSTALGNTSAVFREWVHVTRRSIDNVIPVPNIITSNYATSSRKKNTNGNRHFRYSVRSVMKFDLDAVLKPTDSITNAVLNLNAGAPTKIWTGVNSNDVNYFAQKTRAHFMNGELYGRSNSSNIKQVIGGWNINTTRFNQLVTGNTSVSLAAAADNSCENRTPNVTTIVRDMVKFPARNNGFVLTLDDVSGGIDNDHSSERTLAFCGGNDAVAFKTLAAVPGDCILCNMTTLTVDYRTDVDTCVKVCRKNIVDTATNPYRWGILGNWRMDKSYTYSGVRQESDASVKNTNIRLEGTIKGFVPWWSFTTAGILPSNDSTRWIWSMSLSAYQRKGFEIEEFDPLGKFNSGLYGYNQTLPVSVAQNSRYREMLFDGFEDYGFKTTNCIACPPKREFDFRAGNSGVDTTSVQSHTGIYSLKINNGFESVLTVPVDTVPNKVQKLSAMMDSIPVFLTTVTGSGDGLFGTYVMGRRRLIGLCTPTGDVHTRTDAAINFNWSSGPPFTPGVQGCNESYRVTWTGSIQPRYSDTYVFYLRYNGTASIVVNGQLIHNNATNQSGERASTPIFLQSGHPYSITIVYNKTVGVSAGPVELRWSSFVSQAKELIPMSFLYPAAPGSADTTGSVSQAIQYYCVKAKTVKPENAIRPTFSPIAKTKITVSAWVRLDVEDCNSTPTPDSAIQVQFNTGNSVWLKKSGFRIEGWQRYEANIDVPANAATMSLRLKTLTANNIFVDDIRVQPYNSEFKSYVYNPANLKLMADLDENNYATFYEYNDDGVIIRIKKETEKGIMTTQESRSALYKE